MTRGETYSWIHPDPAAHMKDVGSILISLVFLHALVAHPLLIECVQADGNYLLEIMGCDPCHGHFGPGEANAAQDADAGVVAAISSGTDPCLDLFMSEPGGTEISAHLLPLSPQAAQQTIALRLPAFPAGSETRTSDFPLKPPPPLCLRFHSIPMLRI